MGIISFPKAITGDTKILGSSSGTITGSGAAQTLGSFTLPSDLGNNTLVVEITLYKTLGNTAQSVSVANTSLAAGASGTGVTTAAAVNSYVLSRITFRKSTGTSTRTMINQYYSNSTAAGAVGQCYEVTDFDVSTTEVFHITASSIAVGQDSKFSWIAYIIGSGVKN